MKIAFFLRYKTSRAIALHQKVSDEALSFLTQAFGISRVEARNLAVVATSCHDRNYKDEGIRVVVTAEQFGRFMALRDTMGVVNLFKWPSKEIEVIEDPVDLTDVTELPLTG